MPAPRRAANLAILLLVVAWLVPASSQAAGGATSEELVKLATEQWKMSCTFSAPSWVCRSSDLAWTATFQPESGPVSTISTRANAVLGEPMDATSQSMMTSLLDATCVPDASAKYVAKVAALTAAGTIADETLVGCRLSGGRVDSRISYHYVTASVLAPTPPPTATPTPGPTPTPTPTTTPTVTPTPTLTRSPAASPPPTGSLPPTGSPTPAGAPTAGPSASLEAGPSPTASAPPSPTAPPAATDLPPTGSPSPTPASAAGPPVASEPPPDVGVLGWVDSVPATAAVRTDPGSAWWTLAAILALLFAMGYIGELFNDTLESNYDRILAWWRHSLLGRLAGSLPWRRGGGG